jgi:N-acetylmuramoyl-L-alanine amidase
MPTVLLELGYMDSATDVPIILTEAYADNCATAIVRVLVERGGLIKKDDTLYRVQVGAYRNKANADNMLRKLKAAGFDGYITT